MASGSQVSYIAAKILFVRFSLQHRVLFNWKQWNTVLSRCSLTSHYIYAPFSGCQLLSEASCPLMSHLHDSMSNDWQVLHTGLTGWYSTMPELVSGGLVFFFLSFFSLHLLLLLKPYYVNFYKWSKNHYVMRAKFRLYTTIVSQYHCQIITFNKRHTLCKLAWLGCPCFPWLLPVTQQQSSPY